MNHHQHIIGYDQYFRAFPRADKMNLAVNFMLLSGLIRLVTEDKS